MIFKCFLLFIFAKTAFALESDENCGVSDSTVGLIFGGEAVKPSEWPWAVAIFQRTDGVKFSYICGGTLITRSKVITAAHCLHEKYSVIVKRPLDLELVFGAHDLSKQSKTSSKKITPSKVTIHPEWDSSVTNFDADIAVLDLPEPLEISKYIRPICNWERRNGAPEFSEGVIVGWGYSSHNKITESVARKLTTPRVSNEKCFLDQPEFVQMSSDRTFCCGARNGTGPCKGDSGSGLYFKQRNKYYLGGIVSASTYKNFNQCDVYNYAVYTEVFKFIPWLSGRKFNEKSPAVLFCERYKNTRPPRPSFFKNSYPASNEAEIGEFPHMAVLGFKNSPSDRITFGCNGVLVSEAFVLSTSTCLSLRGLMLVRLGAITEGDKDPKGVPIAVDFTIKVCTRKNKFSQSEIKSFQALHKHPEYSKATKQHDVGVIQLASRANFSYFIWPACLQTRSEDSRKFWLYSGRHLGANEEQKQNYLKVPAVQIPHDECKGVSKNFNVSFASHLCVKSVINGLSICTGSSEYQGGGPVQLLQSNTFYVGGLSSCSSASSDLRLTEVFVRIASHIDWIEDVVWSEEELQRTTPLKTQRPTTTKPRITEFIFPDN